MLRLVSTSNVHDLNFKVFILFFNILELSSPTEIRTKTKEDIWDFENIYFCPCLHYSNNFMFYQLVFYWENHVSLLTEDFIASMRTCVLKHDNSTGEQLEVSPWWMRNSSEGCSCFLKLRCVTGFYFSLLLWTKFCTFRNLTPYVQFPTF